MFLRVVVLILSLLWLLPVSADEAHIGEMPFFEDAPCPMPVNIAETVRCGYLVVPEDRTDPASPMIRLAVAIIRTSADNPAPDPVIYLNGGPGGAALEHIDFYASSMSHILEQRDVILLDQRGVGFSVPSLSCPEFIDVWYGNLATVLTLEEEIAQNVAAAASCSQTLRESGVNLNVYNSANNAADVEDLRRALGYETWNLYGISYGTRLALTIMRDYPQGVRSVVLDGVVPLQRPKLVDIIPAADRAFREFFALCEALCPYENLEARFWALVEQLNESPVLYELDDPRTGEVYDILITGDLLLDTTFRTLYSPVIMEFLAPGIAQAEAGEYRIFAALALIFLEDLRDFNIGMYYSTNCSENTQLSDRANVEALAVQYPDLQFFIESSLLEFAICDAWGVETADEIEMQPVYSDIPTLLLSGQLDPITPPRNGEMAAETL
ncbi:MAG: alpha/beta fold hydrolase, partial [Chloroflexi bacterium]